MNNVEIKRVLFVCVENSCRSQLAEAISNHLFSNHLKAFSAGSRPSGKVNPKAIASLERIGIEHKGKSKSVDEIKGSGFDLVVGMGCWDECPNIPGSKRVEWNIPDPKEYGAKGFNKIRDQIKEKIVSDLLWSFPINRIPNHLVKRIRNRLAIE